MRYFTQQELLRSVLLTVAYGLALPLLRLLAECLLLCPLLILALPRGVYRRWRGAGGVLLPAMPSRLGTHLTDLVFGLLAGCGLLLVLYVGTDGTLRLYVLLLTAGSAWLCQRLVGRPLRRAGVCVGRWLYAAVVGVLALLLRPLWWLLSAVYRRAVRPLGQRFFLRCTVWQLRHRLRRVLAGTGRSLMQEGSQTVGER